MPSHTASFFSGAAVAIAMRREVRPATGMTTSWTAAAVPVGRGRYLTFPLPASLQSRHQRRQPVPDRLERRRTCFALAVGQWTGQRAIVAKRLRVDVAVDPEREAGDIALPLFL